MRALLRELSPIPSIGWGSQVGWRLGPQVGSAVALSPALQERDGIRAAAMALFGDLVAAMAGRELSGLRTQVHQSMVPLLLHLKDCCPAVITVSACRGAFPGCAGKTQVAGATGRGSAEGSRAT